MNRFTSAIEKQKWVPQIQMGTAANAGNNVMTLIEVMGINAAKDLALDINIKKYLNLKN